MNSLHTPRVTKFLRAFAASVAAVAVALAASACSGIGQGNALESIAIVPTGGKEGDASVTVFECLRDSLFLNGRFTDGQVGFFTSRATWKSSDTSVVRVSNGDEPVPNASTFFTRGTLIPVSPGTATVTADFVGLHTSIVVNVATATSFTVEPSPAFVGVGATQQLRLKADLNGRIKDVTGSATWALDSDPSSIATISTAGVVTGVGIDGNNPLTARASFDPVCTTTPTGTVRAGNVASLDLAYEDGFTSNLVLLNLELLKVTGNIDVDGDGAGNGTQDLGTQITFTTDPTPQTFISSGISGFAHFIRALALDTSVNPDGNPTPVTFTANFGKTDASPGVDSNALTVTAIQATRTAVSVAAPAAKDSPTRLGYKSEQYEAIAMYDDGAGGTFTQKVTRLAKWSSSDTSLATVCNLFDTICSNLLDAGVVSSVVNTNGSPVTIEARIQPAAGTTDCASTAANCGSASYNVDPAVDP